ncbi:hypothetical protein E4U60_000316 [Claviceps pazoutovae]|uniref:Uncharacterized protein n=1 Tax=Claviceps pazoutovae TaxID=1649127 RepID=A0A9P7SH69_9HYPO|nr:hypothetical protein E4U60_000316 [Claviceps pazoutovae]
MQCRHLRYATGQIIDRLISIAGLASPLPFQPCLLFLSHANHSCAPSLYIANQTFAFPAARLDDEIQHRCEEYWFFERLLPNVRILLLPKKTSSQEDVPLGEDCVSDMRCPYCRHVRPPLH